MNSKHSSAIELEEPSSQAVYEYFTRNRENLIRRYGEKLPGEYEIAQLFGVDRFTLRRAIKRLVDEGNLHLVRNKGVYFHLPVADVEISPGFSYSRFCREQNLSPRSELLDITTETAKGEVARNLGLNENDYVWNLYFLRFKGELPLCLTRSYLPHKRIPALIRHLKKNPSLYAILSEVYDIRTRRCRSLCTAGNATRNEAKFLDLPLSFALLRVSSLAVDQDGMPIEFCETSYRSDLVRLSFNVVGAETAVEPETGARI